METGFESISKGQLISQWVKDELTKPKNNEKLRAFNQKMTEFPHIENDEENRSWFQILKNLNGAIGENYENINNCRRGLMNLSQFLNLRILHDGKNEDTILKATEGTRKLKDLINGRQDFIGDIKNMYKSDSFIEYLVKNECPKRLFVCKNADLFTIVDGNHRAIAIVFNQDKTVNLFPIEVYLFDGPFG